MDDPFINSRAVARFSYRGDVREGSMGSIEPTDFENPFLNELIDFKATHIKNKISLPLLKFQHNLEPMD